MSVDKILGDYLNSSRDDEPTVRFVRSHSSPTIEMRAEALAMCLEILSSVPEPNDSTEKVLWKQAQQALKTCKTERALNDLEIEPWQSAPMPSPSGQNSRKLTNKGFRIRKEIK